jgi:hypothetical protein
MEALAPSLELLLEVRFGLEKGSGIRATVQDYIEVHGRTQWGVQLEVWFQLYKMDRSTLPILNEMCFARRQVLELIEQGLRGAPIYSQVCFLQDELIQSTQLEIAEFVTKLPLKSLFPLLLLQFPAFLILLLGPFLTQFFAQS